MTRYRWLLGTFVFTAVLLAAPWKAASQAEPPAAAPAPKAAPDLAMTLSFDKATVPRGEHFFPHATVQNRGTASVLLLNPGWFSESPTLDLTVIDTRTGQRLAPITAIFDCPYSRPIKRDDFVPIAAKTSVILSGQEDNALFYTLLSYRLSPGKYRVTLRYQHNPRQAREKYRPVGPWDEDPLVVEEAKLTTACDLTSNTVEITMP